MSYAANMAGLPTQLYVALRTAPKSLVKGYASARSAMEGDQATREMVDLILKVLERYNVELEPETRPPGPRTW